MCAFSEVVVDSEEKPRRSPILAAILNFIVAELGQICNGQVIKGVIVIVIQLVDGALTAIFDRLVTTPARRPLGHDRRLHDGEAQQRAVQLQVVSTPWTDETY